MRVVAAVAATLVALAACSIDIPEGAYACRVDADCPPRLSCYAQRCYREPPDGGEADAAGPGEAVDPERDGCTEDDCDASSPPSAPCEGASCDASSPATEECNGADDDSDGLLDEGLVELRPVATLPARDEPVYARVLPAPDGSVIVVEAERNAELGLTIFVTQLAADGGVLRSRQPLATAGDYPIEAALDGDTLGLLRATDDRGPVVTAYDARTLAPVLTEVALVAGAESQPTYDLAVTRDALGPHLYVAYYEGPVLTLAAVALSTEPEPYVERSELVTTDADTFYPYLQLSAAPCSRALYLQLRRRTPEPVARILGVYVTGELTGLDLAIPLPAGEGLVLSSARSVLEGGSCQRSPEALYTAFGRFLADDPAAPDPGDVREPGRAFFDVVRVDLATATTRGTDAAPDWRVRVDSPRPPMPQDLRTPASRNLALALAQPGALWLAATTVEPDARTGDITAFMLAADGGRRTFAAGSVAPAIASQLDMAAGADGQLWLAGSWWTERAPTRVFTLACN